MDYQLLEVILLGVEIIFLIIEIIIICYDVFKKKKK